jgi:hypothetical protein
MPKYRQLHLKIIDSDDFNAMPNDFTRVVWMMLMLIVDSEGRGIGNYSWIKSKMFPMREDVTNDQIKESFEWLANKEMIIFYDIENRRYFYIPTFKDYQTGTAKEGKSYLPAPPITTNTNSVVTPELVQSSSNDTVLYCIESELHCIEEETISKIPTERNVERIFTEVTGMVSIPNNERRGGYVEAIMQMLQSYGRDETYKRMKSAWDTWVDKVGKNGKSYSKTNLAWIDFAIAGETLGEPAKLSKFERDQKELEELIAKAKK